MQSENLEANLAHHPKPTGQFLHALDPNDLSSPPLKTKQQCPKKKLTPFPTRTPTLKQICMYQTLSFPLLLFLIHLESWPGWVVTYGHHIKTDRYSFADCTTRSLFFFHRRTKEQDRIDLYVTNYNCSFLFYSFRSPHLFLPFVCPLLHVHSKEITNPIKSSLAFFFADSFPFVRRIYRSISTETARPLLLLDPKSMELVFYFSLLLSFLFSNFPFFRPEHLVQKKQARIPPREAKPPLFFFNISWSGLHIRRKFPAEFVQRNIRSE